MVYTALCPSPLGEISMAERDGCLCGLWLPGQTSFLHALREQAQAQETPVLSQTADWLRRYFAGERPEPSELPLCPVGSEFRRTVWQLLLELPYGTVTTYGALAKKTGALLGRQRMSAQAIGGAVGHNPISVVIPCHRVVGADGSLTGYAGGLDKKIALLTLEGVELTCGAVRMA